MYIQYIELYNFKSFNGYHKIGPLNKNIAIVGPYGSGHTNFLEAILFVMAIELKYIRINTIRDLIYVLKKNAENGVPNQIECYVKIQLIIDDDKEIIFQRSIINSDMEHKINDEIVSEDIYRSQFYDLNINAYKSSILQLMASKIAADDAENCTKHLEVISESNQFTDEYNVLLQQLTMKLELKNSHQSEIEIIERQHNEMQLKEKQFIKYNQIKSDLDAMEIKYFLYQLYRLENEYKKLNIELQEPTICERLLKFQLTKNKKLNAQIKLLKSKNIEFISAKNDLKNVTTQQIDLLNFKTNTKKELFIKKTVHEFYELELEQLKRQQIHYELDIKNDEKIIEEIKRKLETLTLIQGKLVTFIDNEDDIYSEYDDLLIEGAAGNNLMELKLNDSVLKRNYVHELKLKEVLNLEKKCSEINTEYLQLKNLNTTKCSEFNRIEIENYELKLLQFEQLNVLEVEKNQCSSNMSDYVEQYFNVLNEMTAIQKENWESERISKQWDIIHILQRNEPGVYNRLNSLCEPIDILYNKVFSLIFANYIDAIVVDKKSTALKCTQILSEYYQGRISQKFLILEDYENVSLNIGLRDKLREQYPTIELAYNIVRYDIPILKSIILFITKDTLVCETMTDAKDIYANNRCDVYSIDGKFCKTDSKIMKCFYGYNNQKRKFDQCADSILNMESKYYEDLLEIGMKKLKFTSNEYEQMNSDKNIIENRITFLNENTTEMNKITELNEKLRLELRYTKPSQKIQSDIKLNENTLVTYETNLEENTNKIESIEKRIFGNFLQKYNINNLNEFEKILIYKNDYGKFKEMLVENLKLHENVLDWKNKRLDQSNKRINELSTECILLDVTDKEKYLHDCENKLQALKQNLDNNTDKIDKLQGEITELEEKIDTFRIEIKKYNKKLIAIEEQLAAITFQIGFTKNEKELLISGNKRKGINFPPELCHIGDDDNSQQDNESILKQYLLSKYELNLEEMNLTEIIQLDDQFSNEINVKQMELIKYNKPKIDITERLEYLSEEKLKYQTEYNLMVKESRQLNKLFEKIKEKRQNQLQTFISYVNDTITDTFSRIVGNTNNTILLHPESPYETYLKGTQFELFQTKHILCLINELYYSDKQLIAFALLFTMLNFFKLPILFLDNIDYNLNDKHIDKILKFLNVIKMDYQIFLFTHKTHLKFNYFDNLIGISKMPNAKCLTSCLHVFNDNNYDAGGDAGEAIDAALRVEN